LQDIT